VDKLARLDASARTVALARLDAPARTTGPRPRC